MSSFFFNLIGLTGVVFILIAFFLIQIKKLSSENFSYSILNLVGAVFIIISLLYEWNLSSFVIEFVWAIISIYGLIKLFKK